MSCPSCGRANRPGARFCGGCGASLVARCAACGAPHEPDARFCDACGAALGAPAPSAHAPQDAIARKVVTIVFADLIGSTALQERLDPESVSRVMEAYHAAVRAPIEAHGGTVVQLLGDGVMCAFGVPQVGEDDALQAVRAGVDVQRSFRAFLAERPELAGKIGLRVAVNTGEVVVSDDYAAGIGDPLNVAGRLQQEARDGDVLLGEATQRLVREHVTLVHVGTFALKGRAEPVAAYRVVSLERPAGAAAVPFVGRENELRRVLAVYDAALAAPATRLAVLLGSPGLGKSRLFGEVARRLGDRATVLTARCEGTGGATFAPLAGALRGLDAALPEGEPDRARIEAGIAALVAGEPAAPQETFFVVRRLLAALAKTQPVVLAIDDLHWAEPLLLDLIEHLVQWGAGVPLLVLGAARPELRAMRSSLATPGAVASEVVTLAGLDAAAATQLAARVIGADALPAAIAGRVLAASEGNPLFLGELIRMLVDDGVLRREGERWTAVESLAQLDMPPTIQALLAARIERLRPEERVVLERAAVVGRHFSRGALAHLLPREAGDLDTKLEALRRSELIEPDTGWYQGEPALRFHHALIRDAAYRRVLKHTRAELHVRLADWIEGRGTGQELDETIGWHLEQAHQSLSDIGPLDARGRGYGERAAQHLGAAGQRALARDDVPLAASLLGRALALLEPGDPARGELALDACEALLAAGAVGPAEQAIADLARFAEGSERLRAWYTCFAGQLAALTDPGALRGTAEAVAAAAHTLAAAGDGAGEAKAHSVHAAALFRLGEIGACEAALDLALAAARRADDRRRSNAVLAGAPLAALWGPSPVARASGRCLDVVRVLRITHGAPGVEAVALRSQAVLEALRGRVDAARRMLDTARRMAIELGIGQQLLETDALAGYVEGLAGEPAAAEARLAPALEGLRAAGLRIDAARAAALLARALLAQGRADEAEALTRESEALAGDDLQASIAWRGVRAEALAARAEHAEAVALARAAVEIAAATDALLHHADARHALAVALRAAGRGADADAEEARALALWEEKGATLLAERARRRHGPRAAAEEAAPLARAAAPRAVPENRASAASAALVAALRSGEGATFDALCADDLEVVHHATGIRYDRAGALTTWQSFAANPEADVSLALNATLGDSLALARISIRANRVAEEGFDVGAIEASVESLIETDAEGWLRRSEQWPSERLGDAIARAYQRYAEQLPPGPARVRAEAIARHVTASLDLTPTDGAFRAALADDIRFRDHRRLGLGAVRGAATIRRGNLVMHEQVAGLATRAEAVLALEPDWLLVHRTSRGIDRVGGGEIVFDQIHLWGFGPDGLIQRLEHFAPDQPERALARLAELKTAAVPRRRVAPNAATANAARMDAAAAVRDLPAFLAELAEGARAIHHPTGAAYAETESRRAYEQLFALHELNFTAEPLATLGDSLALLRRRISFAAGEAPGGGPFGESEMETLVVAEVDAGGLRTLTEFFATDRLGEAVSRLYERYAEHAPAAERERAEATHRALARLTLGGQLLPVIAPDAEYADHRPLGFPALRGRLAIAGWLDTLRTSTAEIRFELEDVLATRPDALLGRWLNTGALHSGGGAFERSFLSLVVFDGAGLVRHWEHFALGREDEALARIDALTGADGAAATLDNLATRSLERFGAALHGGDEAGLRALFAPDFVHSDRRRLVRTEGGRDDFVGSLLDGVWGARLQIGSPAADGVFATRGERLALTRYTVRSQGEDVGPTQSARLMLVETDAAGLRTALVTFDADAEEEARAELDARFAAGEGTGLPEQLAAMRAFLDAFARRDWAAQAALYAPALVVHDRRPLGWESIGAEAYLESLRVLVALAPDTQLRLDHVRCAACGMLWLGSWVGTREGGAFETPWITVSEHDAAGRVARIDTFDPGQLAAARARLAELDAPRENAAKRSADALARALAALDWPRIEAALAPDFRCIDRQRTAQLSSGRTEYLAALREMLLAFTPPLTVTTTPIAMRGERFVLGRLRFAGSGAGVGPSEFELLELAEVDAAGRIVLEVAFDPDAEAEAFAELERRHAESEAAEFAQAAAFSIPPNAAMRSGERRLAAFEARDWPALRALCAESMVHDDRRRGVHVRGDRELFLQSYQVIAERGAHAVCTLLATAGDHLALERLLTHGGKAGAEFEVEFLRVTEVDAEGRAVAILSFDPEDRAAAADEMAARYAARGAPAPLRDWIPALLAHDAARIRALLAGDFECHDHRRTGLGPLDADAYVASLMALWQEAPDARPEFLCELARSEHGVLIMSRWFGKLTTGGAFESPSVNLTCFEAGRSTRLEIWELEDLPRARARFEALRADPLRPPPNAADRMMDRHLAVFEAGDWEALAALCAPDMAFEDRRRGVLMSGDRELMLASLRTVHGRARATRTLLATAGERLALAYVRWRGVPGRPPLEVDALTLSELDAAGRLVALVSFDPRDRRAAAEELFVRYQRGKGAHAVSPDFVAFVLAMNAHDAARARALLPDDFVFQDHRRTGLGRLGNADDYVTSLVALWEQSPDAFAETLYYIAQNERASLNVGRLSGTLRGGGAFESPFVHLCRFERGRFVGAELFEVDDLPRARARFAELSPDPLHIPPNAAVRAGERVRELALARDWEGLRRLVEPVVFEDRRPLFRTVGGAELLVANSQQLGRSVWKRTTRTLLATSGDRLALHENHFRGREETGEFEVDNLEVTEVDAAGRITAAIIFDPSDRRAAALEMSERYFRGEAAAYMPLGAMELVRAAGARDLARVKAVLPEDLAFCDHRRTGAGRVEGREAYLEWLASLWSESPDAGVEVFRTLAIGPHGRVSLVRTFGTRDGGAFESVFVALALTRGDKVWRYEFYDVADEARALARFEAERP